MQRTVTEQTATFVALLGTALLLPGCGEQSAGTEQPASATAGSDSGGTVGVGEPPSVVTGSGGGNAVQSTGTTPGQPVAGASTTMSGGRAATAMGMTSMGAGGAASGTLTNSGAQGGASMATSSTTQGGSTTSSWVPTFDTHTLATDFVSEGAAVGDIDGDSIQDLVAGPHWDRGPDWEFGGALFEVPTLTRDQYSIFFLTFVDDLNGDGHADVIGIGDAGGGNGSGNPNAFWYENPGPSSLDQPWTKHPLFDGLVSNESPGYVDLIGDAAKELVFMTGGAAGLCNSWSDA